MELTVNIKGLSQLARTLERDIPEALAKSGIKNALIAAAKPVETSARHYAAAHRVTGDMESDIGSTVKVSTGKSLHGTALVGPLYKNKGTDDPGVYDLFVEEGHGPPGSAKERRAAARRGVEVEFGGKNTPPHPWLRPAWEESKDEALNVLISTLTEEVEAAGKAAAQ